jgi:hypothetical protein
MMKSDCLISFVICVAVAASAAAGDLWINCEAGLEVFLDGEHVGVSEEAEFGKLLRGVASGEHTIRIEKESRVPLEFSLSVGFAANQVVVGALSPEISEVPSDEAEEETEERGVGMIAITSDPSECNVKLAGLRVPKIKPIMTFPNIPVGEHKLWFESSGTVLSETVLVQEAQTVEIRVDFRNQRIAMTEDASDAPGDGSEAEEESPRTEPECIEYWVEVIRTSNIEDIEAASSQLEDLGFPENHQKRITVEDDSGLPAYKLRVGPVPRRSDAKYPAHLIKQAGFRSVWIVPEECQGSPLPKPKTKSKPVL